MFDYLDYHNSDNVNQYNSDYILHDGMVHKIKIEFSTTKQIPITSTCTTKCNMVVPYIRYSPTENDVYCIECFSDKITDVE